MKFRLANRGFLTVLFAAGGLFLHHSATGAESGWQPTGPVEIVVPTGSGG